jgi:hypothetical protein
VAAVVARRGLSVWSGTQKPGQVRQGSLLLVSAFVLLPFLPSLPSLDRPVPSSLLLFLLFLAFRRRRRRRSSIIFRVVV